MAHTVYNGEFGTPILRIEGQNHVVEFSIEGFPADRHEWLGKVLDKQINDAIQRNVDLAIAGQQKALRALAGLE